LKEKLDLLFERLKDHDPA